MKPAIGTCFGNKDRLDVIGMVIEMAAAPHGAFYVLPMITPDDGETWLFDNIRLLSGFPRRSVPAGYPMKAMPKSDTLDHFQRALESLKEKPILETPERWP